MPVKIRKGECLSEGAPHMRFCSIGRLCGAFHAKYGGRAADFLL